MKKIFYTLGATAAVTAPIIATVSCGTNKQEQSKKQSQTANQHELAAYKNYDLTIDVRIPDFTKEVEFDAATFDKAKFIEDWVTKRTGTGRNRQLVTTHMMVPYVIDREIKIEHSNAQTLGGLLDEANKLNKDLFTFNQSLEEAGEMGRFLMGIKKSDNELKKISDIEHFGDWGIDWTQKPEGDWIQQGIMGGSSAYISLSSPNNAQAVQNSHETFDKNESFHAFDGRLPKGVDGINVASRDIYYLNLWKMI